MLTGNAKPKGVESLTHRMKTLRECIKDAEARRVAVGHFNISNLEGLRAIFNSARALSLPIIIGVSEGEREYIGLRQTVALVRSFREEYDYPIYLNADHTYTFEGVKAAIDAGFDAAIIDGAKLPLEENIALTKRCVEYARASGRDVLIEAELGYIGSGSTVLKEIPEGAAITIDQCPTGADAKAFVDATGIDLLSPAVGNIHGMLASGVNPPLFTDRAKEIYDVAGVPLVLHGGSGTPDADFVKVIQSGMAVVHINTEIRVAYRDALKKQIAEHPDEVSPYKITKPTIAAMEEVITRRLKLFNNISA